MIHEIIETGPLQVNCQIVGDERHGEGVLIDPGGEAGPLMHRMNRLGLRLMAIINTHGHFDHIGAVAELQQVSGAPFWLHEADAPLVAGAREHAGKWGLPFGEIPRIDQTMEDGQVIPFGGFEIAVIHTPGHTPGGVCLDWKEGVAVGDTLFAGSIGRTDLPGGDHGQLIASIREKLLTLDDETVCHPGHGPSTTIGQERVSNPYIGGY